MDDFNKFADNDYCVTISLAEYRELVSENARLQYAMELMQQQTAMLTERLAESEGFPPDYPPEDEDEQADE